MSFKLSFLPNGSPMRGTLKAERIDGAGQAYVSDLLLSNPRRRAEFAAAAAEATGEDAAAIADELNKLAAQQFDAAAKDEPTDALPEHLEDPSPCPGPVDGDRLLDDLAATFRRHAVLPEHAAEALALWTLLTYVSDDVDTLPLLCLASPEKRCGKTTVLSILSRLVHRPVAASNITPAALFRAVEKWRPTLLIDEADTFLKANDELRGILNSGHTRDSAYTIRCVGDEHEPQHFSTWCPKAISLIGRLPGTLADRSIVLSLKRKLPTERCERLCDAERERFDTLRQRCARWAQDNADKVRLARPAVPGVLHDRAADNWRPLLAIAAIAGGRWPDLAETAAVALFGSTDDETESLAVLLLRDVVAVFAETGAERLPTAELVRGLVAMEDRPWGEANGGRPINGQWIARRLRHFGIEPRTLRLGGALAKGYLVNDFTDAAARYACTPSHNSNSATSSADKDSTVTPAPDVTATPCAGVTPKPLREANVTPVTPAPPGARRNAQRPEDSPEDGPEDGDDDGDGDRCPACGFPTVACCCVGDGEADATLFDQEPLCVDCGFASDGRGLDRNGRCPSCAARALG